MEVSGFGCGTALDESTNHRHAQSTNKDQKHKAQRPKRLCFEKFVFCVLFVFWSLCFVFLVYVRSIQKIGEYSAN